MVTDAIRRSWCGMLSSLLLTAVFIAPMVAGAQPTSGSPPIDDCELALSAPISIADIGAGIKAKGIRDEALDCYITSLLVTGVAPADAAEGLLAAGYEVFDVVRAIVIVGGAAVVVDVVARVNTVLGPTVRQTVRDGVAEAVLVRDANARATHQAVAGLKMDDCELELSAPMSVEGIAIAVKAAGVRDDLLDCYVASLLEAGVAPADVAEGLLLAGYVVFDVVRAIVMIGGPDVAGDVVERANTVYCQMLTKGATECGSSINQTVADAALAGAAVGAVATDSMPEYMALVAAGEIVAGAQWLGPVGDAGGMNDASRQ